ARSFQLALDDRARQLRAPNAVRIIEIDLRSADLEQLLELFALVPLLERLLRRGAWNGGQEHDEKLALVGARRKHGAAIDDARELGERAQNYVDLHVEPPLDLLHDAFHEPSAIREAAAKQYIAALQQGAHVAEPERLVDVA